MKSILESMDKYFKKLLESIGDNKLMISNVKNAKNLILVSQFNDDGWSEWHPMKKDTMTSFNELEEKLGITFHNDICDYYNSYWFYETYGYIYIDPHMNFDVIELQGVITGQELTDLSSSIDNYYRNGDINQIRMIPIGIVQNLFVVVDNVTGQVFVDDRIEFGVFRKIADSLIELIDNLKIEPSIA